MKVSNQPNINSVQQGDQPVEIKKGEVYPAVIKERISSNEAVVQIKGKDVRVSFEDKVPLENRTAVQITDVSGKVQVRVASDQQKAQLSTAYEAQILKNAGTALSPELRQAVQMLSANGVAIDRDMLENIKNFMDKSPGSIEQKLETLRVMMVKGLEMTQSQMKAVHEALNGESLGDALIKAASKLIGKDIELSANNLSYNKIENEDIRRNIEVINFLNSSTGSEKEKLEVIKFAVENKIELTKENLEALQKQISSAGQDPSDNIGLSFKNDQEIKNILKQAGINENSELGNTLKMIFKGGELDSAKIKALMAQLVDAVRQGESMKNSQAIDYIKGLLELVGKDNGVETVMENLKSLIAELEAANGSLHIDTDISSVQLGDRLNSIVNGVEKLDGMGMKTTAVNRLVSELDRLKDEMEGASQENRINSLDISVDEINSQTIQAAQMVLNLNGKDILVTEVTKRMAKATDDFRNLKRDIVRNIDNINRMVGSTSQNVSDYVKPSLERTIDLLDKAILKSDITLFTDMKTEKKLMRISTDLAAAKEFIAKGDNEKAFKIMSDVKSTLEGMNWKPSKTKVVHFMTKMSSMEECGSPEQKLAYNVKDILENDGMYDSSPRKTFDRIRQLGVTHDSDAARLLLTSKPMEHQEDIENNMKSVIMKLMTNSEEGQLAGRNSQNLEQVMNNILGQQLLSKNEPNQNVQTMFFNIPLNIGGSAENVKVYVNGKKERDKIDWENCSVYFLIDTKKAGETGILLSSSNKNLFVTIKNDMKGIEDKMTPMISGLKENLKEIGYNMGGVSFTKLNSDNDKPQASSEGARADISKPSQHKAFMKGFDTKI